MTIEGDEVAYDGRFLTLLRRHFRDRAGNAGVWEMVTRKTHGPIVAIAAVTKAHELVVNRIFRVPLACDVLELPAGLMDQPGERPDETVRRELLEETGYRVDDVEELVRGPYNTGLSTDELVVYLGRNAVRIQEPRHEASEDITVLAVPLDGLEALLHHPPYGVRVDLKMFAVLHLLRTRPL